MRFLFLKSDLYTTLTPFGVDNVLWVQFLSGAFSCLHTHQLTIVAWMLHVPRFITGHFKPHHLFLEAVLIHLSFYDLLAVPRL